MTDLLSHIFRRRLSLFVWNAPFTSVSSAAPQEYHCSPQGFHLICTCCLQPMPDRLAEQNNQLIVSQQCEFSKHPLVQMCNICAETTLSFNTDCVKCFLTKSWLIVRSYLKVKVFTWCVVLTGTLCQRPFCHMYWGCQRIGCQGCLARFSGSYSFNLIWTMQKTCSNESKSVSMVVVPTSLFTLNTFITGVLINERDKHQS